MRAGNFSSSEIYKLIGEGKYDGFLKSGATYIKEKQYEQRLGRELSNETNARPTSWGNLLELYVWQYKIPLNDYRFEHKQRYVHTEIENWTGCPDLVSDEKVADIKCPFTLKAFCDVIDCFDDPEKLKAEKPEYYWQLVSNSILTGKNIAELIVYVPYLEELADIRLFLDTDVFAQNGLDMNKFSFLNWAQDEDLPYLIKGNEYQDFNVMTFEVPEEDKNILFNRVQFATELLNEKT